VNGKF
jgi:hypothetical protein